MYKLNILWSTDVRENFFNLVSAYAYNAKANNWWEEINIIIWGKSAMLLAEDEEVRAELSEMMKQGIRIEACKECCEKLGITDLLLDMGIRVDYLGGDLTGYIKAGEPVLTI